MQRSALAAVALAALLLTAGCSGILDSGTPTTEPGTAASPGQGSGSSPASGAGDAVPGVEDGTLTDATALLDAHQRALVATGFETDVRVNATTVRQGSVVTSQRRQRTVVEPSLREYRYRTTNSPGGGTIQFDHWANESVSVVRGQLGDTVQYRVRDPQSAAVLTARPLLDNYLAEGELRVVGTEESDGRTLVTLRSTTVPSDADALPTNATNVRDYEARVVVDTEGRIHGVLVTATYDLEGEAREFRVGYDLVRIDEPSVSQPQWAAEALANQGSGS